MDVGRGVETTVKNVVVVEERKELECGGEMDKRCSRKTETIVLKELWFPNV